MRISDWSSDVCSSDLKIIGDDPSNVNEKYYGNNDVEGPDARHGTHVAGIIAANRNNEIGVKGIAANVKLMSVDRKRVVQGQSVSVRVDLGGGRLITQQKRNTHITQTIK